MAASKLFGMAKESRPHIPVVSPTGELLTHHCGATVNSSLVEWESMRMDEHGWAVLVNPRIQLVAERKGYRLAAPFFEAEGMQGQLAKWYAMVRAATYGKIHKAGESAKGTNKFPDHMVPDGIKAIQRKHSTEGMWNPDPEPKKRRARPPADTTAPTEL